MSQVFKVWISECLSFWVKHYGNPKLGCVTDHSPPTSAEVKKAQIYTSTSQYVFMA
jgi:hypothetical protein